MTILACLRARGFGSLVFAGFCLAGGAQPVHAGSAALDCRFANTEASPWRVVTPLSQATPIGATLYQRTVSLFVNYKYSQQTTLAHELVYAGHWQPHVNVQNGVVRTNVDGIGFKWAGVSSEGVERAITQSTDPLAVSKIDVIKSPGAPSDSDTDRASFRQYLILEKPASQLPEGKLVVNDLPGSPIIALYAVDKLKGEVALGETVSVPTITVPANLCKSAIQYTGPGSLSIGGGGEIEVPNACEVQSNLVVPVDLGHFALNQFGSVNAVSQPVNFSIVLNRCAAAAKPAISFRDKAAQANPDKTLLQLSAPGGQPLAHGFNIVMTNALTGERIAYDEPDTALRYPMRRVGDTAEMPLRAQYIRTGADSELRPGYAGGAAEFTFTFP